MPFSQWANLQGTVDEIGARMSLSRHLGEALERLLKGIVNAELEKAGQSAGTGPPQAYPWTDDSLATPTGQLTPVPPRPQ